MSARGRHGAALSAMPPLGLWKPFGDRSPVRAVRLLIMSGLTVDLSFGY